LQAINWETFPDNRTFGRIIKLFNQKHCNELHEVETVAREKVWEKKWFGPVTLDLDSFVIGVNGSQEGAEKGFNPKNSLQKSYHPRLMFYGGNQGVSPKRFCTGSAYTGNGAREFIKEYFSPRTKLVWKVFVR